MAALEYLRPLKQLRLIESADNCLNISELAIHWAAERLYGVEGHGPYDDLALEFRFLFWYSALQTC
ncbi:MAG: hypothetical protein HW415_850 [Deltaproteobacteria bacterium]|nr:hypothetical protein [Deltaproteobacteria bacterium]